MVRATMDMAALARESLFVSVSCVMLVEMVQRRNASIVRLVEANTLTIENGSQGRDRARDPGRDERPMRAEIGDAVPSAEMSMWGSRPRPGIKNARQRMRWRALSS